MGDGSGDGRETKSERLDRELIELLNELRVALPGVQVLFAFLLTLPFTGKFGSLSEGERDVYFATFCATIGSVAFLMSPTAFHRLRWRQRDKEAMLRIANVFAVIGLAALAVAISLASYLIADLLFGETGAAVTVGVTAALLAVLWFVLPLGRRAMRDD
jgi:uncharacterized membrane protein YhaH (DUF805 family)